MSMVKLPLLEKSFWIRRVALNFDEFPVEDSPSVMVENQLRDILTTELLLSSPNSHRRKHIAATGKSVSCHQHSCSSEGWTACSWRGRLGILSVSAPFRCMLYYAVSPEAKRPKKTGYMSWVQENLLSSLQPSLLRFWIPDLFALITLLKEPEKESSSSNLRNGGLLIPRHAPCFCPDPDSMLIRRWGWLTLQREMHIGCFAVTKNARSSTTGCEILGMSGCQEV